MNEILLICKKLKINFNEVVRLAKSKWNFLNFKPGLVGGHCLPVDPHYLSSIARKNNFITRVVLAGRKINDYMFYYVIKELNSFLNKRNKSLKNSKIFLVSKLTSSGISTGPLRISIPSSLRSLPIPNEPIRLLKIEELSNDINDIIDKTEYLKYVKIIRNI